MRSTSARAYRIALESGLVSRIKGMILKELIRNENMTAGEVANRIILKNGNKLQIDSIRPMFAQLKRMNLIVESGERHCSISRVKCITWIPTYGIPIKFVSKKKVDLNAVLENLISIKRISNDFEVIALASDSIDILEGK